MRHPTVRLFSVPPAPAPRPSYYIRSDPPPSIALTLVITLLFGVFGLIPAAIHAGRARSVGAPTGKYWAACLIPLVGVWLVVLLMVVR